MKKPYHLLLLLTAILNYACSKSKDDTAGGKKGFAPIAAVITEGATNTPFGNIAFSYNNNNQLSGIKEEISGTTTAFSYEYYENGLVSKVTVKRGAVEGQYLFIYNNQRLISYSIISGTSVHNWEVVWDPSGKKCTQQLSATAPGKIYLSFADNNNISEHSGGGNVTSARLTFGTGKGVFGDFPLQLAHIIPLQSNILYYYFGSTSEIRQMILSSTSCAVENQYDKQGNITKSVVSASINDRLTTEFRYQEKSL